MSLMIGLWRITRLRCTGLHAKLLIDVYIPHGRVRKEAMQVT